MIDWELTMEWLKHEGKLVLSGRPVSIALDPDRPDMPFRLDQEGRDSLHYHTLAAAKMDGERHARESAEFEPD